MTTTAVAVATTTSPTTTTDNTSGKKNWVEIEEWKVKKKKGKLLG